MKGLLSRGMTAADAEADLPRAVAVIGAPIGEGGPGPGGRRRSLLASCAIGAALVVVLAGSLAARVAAADKPTNVARGKQLYMATGCYQCHGTSGEGGGGSGPRLAPGPMPYEGLLIQLRKPRARMPVYTAVVMPDADVADIYAYLQSVPKGKTASEIPMLKALSAN